MHSQPEAVTTQPVQERITFRSRRWVRPEDLNAHGSLFGGSLLRWVDEEAAIHAILQLGNRRAVTKYISEIDFVSTARQGDMIEMGISVVKFGRTSITLRAEVRNMITRSPILSIDSLVFVSVDGEGRPVPHGLTTPIDTDAEGGLTPA
ncbi:acyl-CoA thioesterase [Demequina flava]|uniref:acyl-CoA thioesterase n=1 Tax=Demequina flava TaxID=1095025 RepID=UPI0009E275CF|nr:hotdog domain-containing protein [Demequina flava]